MFFTRLQGARPALAKPEKKQRQRQKKQASRHSSLHRFDIICQTQADYFYNSIMGSSKFFFSSNILFSPASSSPTVSSISQEVIELKSRLQATITAMETYLRSLQSKSKPMLDSGR